MEHASPVKRAENTIFQPVMIRTNQARPQSWQEICICLQNNMSELQKFLTAFTKDIWGWNSQNIQEHSASSPKLNILTKKECTASLVMAAAVRPGQPGCAIIWKILSPVCRDPGRSIPRSRQTRLKISLVIASQIFQISWCGQPDLVWKTEPAQPGQPVSCNRGLSVR
mgnify:CR=1 FL=1